MILCRRLRILIGFDKIRCRTVVFIAENHLTRIVHVFFLCVFESYCISPGRFFPVTPYFQSPVLLLNIEFRHFSRLIFECMDITFQRPKNTMVIISVRHCYKFHRRIFFHVHNISLVVLILRIMQFIVLVVPHNHVRRHIQS